MDNDKTVNELLDEAIRDAFAQLKVDDSEQSLKKVETLMTLQREGDKAQNDYYIRATAVDNETQKLADEEKRDREEHKLKTIMLKAVPEFVKTGMTSISLFIMIKIVKKYEKDGYLIKFGDIASKYVNTLIR